VTRAEHEIERILESTLSACGMGALGAHEKGLLSAFLREVASWGEKLHLIGRGALAENIGTQLLDSLLLIKATEERFAAILERPKVRLADIGSGAGFPAIPWKIIRPGIDIMLFERRLKPSAFLSRAIPLLGLSDARASDSDAAHAEAGAFDIVTSKAAGRLSAILPIAERLLVHGGIYVTIKGRAWGDEIRRAGTACSLEYIGADALHHGRGFALFFSKSG
jgi:16S rRNA (guanine527-N7)-methyltransferase